MSDFLVKWCQKWDELNGVQHISSCTWKIKCDIFLYCSGIVYGFHTGKGAETWQTLTGVNVIVGSRDMCNFFLNDNVTDAFVNRSLHAFEEGRANIWHLKAAGIFPLLPAITCWGVITLVLPGDCWTTIWLPRRLPCDTATIWAWLPIGIPGRKKTEVCQILEQWGHRPQHVTSKWSIH